ncbi:tetratricopeptide repeat protein [Streptomyces seoulensis]|uniref:tetratricopeptide repeat protein n=1 Tax=Streptomyces seoulensis TaxID=73044 RepID=UPI001FCA4C08|nr:tetratricopeptide repeat protein [Streptomyces seoulensis]BDH07162.1 Tat pathway signal protein [Streptomyces seoulensis]
MTARRERNDKLAEILAESGLTYETLAKATRAIAAEAGVTVRTSRSAVHAWVASGAIPAGDTPLYVAEALSRKLRRPVTVTELGLGQGNSTELTVAPPEARAYDLGRLIVNNRRDFLKVAFSYTALTYPLSVITPQTAAATLRDAGTNRRVSTSEVATVRQFTETFRAADERLGGGHGLAVIAVFLSDVISPMLSGTFQNSDVRRSAFEAASAHATLVGWKCHDAGKPGPAQHFYNLAFQLACEADPAGLAAWTMRALAHQALDLGHPAGTVDLAEAALARARGRVDRHTEALLLITAARAHGANGNRAAAASLIAAAQEAASAGSCGLPFYAAAAGPTAAVVASHTGRTLTEMGDHAAAERHYREALNERVEDTYRRGRALTLANIGNALAAQIRPEEAVIMWGRSLDLMGDLDSHRARQELNQIRATLTLYTKRKIHGAADLDQRVSLLSAPPA